MTFVTVGNATQGFRRLLEAVDQLAGQGLLGNDILIQIGNNPDFRPVHCKAEAFISPERFERRIQEAELVISHAGAGTLIHLLQVGKVPVVMPRRKKYGEHVDDHQLEVVQALVAEGRVVPAYESEDLPSAVAEARRRNVQRIAPSPSRMLSLVAQAIEELLGRKL